MAPRRSTSRTPSRSGKRSPRTTTTVASQATVIDTPVVEELRTSFLAYALSVIVARALPDARDGLKPVHRRILFSLYAQGIRPDSPYKKSSRVVGDTMGKYHPHGDSAIYEALVRLAQDFAMRVPLVDPHGNFGSLDDSPAASRYTECRLAHPGLALLESLDEDTVDFQDNYDGTESEPSVLPCGYPNLLVNGSTGVAVGMATNIPPHNLAEVVAAAKLLLAEPNTSIKELCKLLPAPDFPTGGEIVNATEMFEMYNTGKGSVLVRAKAVIVDLPKGRKGIEVTELPYMVGPEKVIARTRELIGEKRLDGIADARDYTDRKTGLKILFEIKPGFDPVAVLAELYRLTPMEESFAASFVALIDGTPRVCTVKDLLSAYLEHRIEVVRRRSEFRLDRASRRLHLVEGLRRALDMIDEIVALIRASKDTETARRKLVQDCAFTDLQAQHILEMPLRRLTSLESKKLEAEYTELRRVIAELQKLLAKRSRLAAQVGTELDEVVARFATPRRTARTATQRTPAAVQTVAASTTPSRGLQLPDTPTVVVRLDGNILARLPHDPATRMAALPCLQVLHTSLQSTLLAVTVDGAAHPVAVHALPEASTGAKLPTVGALLGQSGAALVGVLIPGALAVLGTRGGVVKRTVVEVSKVPAPIITLAPGDALVAALPCPETVADLVFVTANGQVLRFPTSAVRPQQRAASGMAAIALADGDTVVAVGAPAEPGSLLAVATDTGAVKFTTLDDIPVKGRATAGVRALRFLSGQSRVTAAAVGTGLQPRTKAGKVLPAPAPARRDASAQVLTAPVAGFVTSVA